MIDWGDGIEDVTGTFPSGVKVYVLHSWATKGTYTIRAKAVDMLGAESDWTEYIVKMPRDKAIKNPFLNFLQDFLQSHPNIFPILQKLLLRFGL